MLSRSPRVDDLDPIEFVLGPNNSMVWSDAAGDVLRHAHRSPVRKLLTQALEYGRADRRAGLFLLDLRLADADGEESLEGDMHDQALITVAARLAGTIRRADTISRTGTDSFAVICHDIPNWAALSAILDRLRAAALRPIQLPGRDVQATLVIDSVFSDDAMRDDLFDPPLRPELHLPEQRRPGNGLRPRERCDDGRSRA